MRLHFFFLLSIALILIAPPAFAADEAPTDCDGCRDSALLARYPSATLVGADQVAFDEVVLPAAAATRDDNDQATLARTLKLAGRLTRLYYLAPQGRSAFEVFANYREAIDKAGMTTVWSCSDEDCGRNFADLAVRTMHLDLENTLEARIGFSDAERPHYLLAESKRAQGDLHVAVLAATLSTRQRAGVYVLIAEGKPMDTGLVTLDANALQRSLRDGGKAVVYGIHFDFGKADVRPDSKPQLDEIAHVLAADPSLRLKITGHTDNVGGADYNRELSRRRAQAIVAVLGRDYGIAADRFSAAGMGADAPVASNDSEDGRAKNRRVELVRQ